MIAITLHRSLRRQHYHTYRLLHFQRIVQFELTQSDVEENGGFQFL